MRHPEFVTLMMHSISLFSILVLHPSLAWTNLPSPHPYHAPLVSSSVTIDVLHPNHGRYSRGIGLFVRATKRDEQQHASVDNSGKDDDDVSTSTYEESGAAPRGVVSSLTGVANFFMGAIRVEGDDGNGNDDRDLNGPPPSSPRELLEIVRDDYVVHNYLWTGNVYAPAFAKNCRFTDPTISFVGRDRFVSNVQNLRPIVEFLIPDGRCESNLLDIRIDEERGFVQSRWNMVGKLSRLPWQPKVDVVGRTKFWYETRDDDNGPLEVVFYDEEWEIPASEALLQLVTPDDSL